MKTGLPRYFYHNYKNVETSIKNHGIYILKDEKTYTIIREGCRSEHHNMGDFYRWIDDNATEITESEAALLM